jgi:WD40 repeat protein
MQSALQLVENTLAKDKSQLSGQLLGHILSPDRSEIQALLEEAKLWKVTPWLRPLIPSLIPAGGPLLRIFSGHQEEVNSLAVTPDGRSVVSGSSDKTVKVWDLKTGIEILTFKGHKSSIRAVVATPDEKQVVSVASGDFIRIWNLKDGKETHAFKDTGRDYNCLAITTNGDQVILGSSDGTIQVWDLSSRHLVQSLKGHSESIKAVAVTPDGRRVISASSEGTLEVWNLSDRRRMFTFKGHDESVNALALISLYSRPISTGFFAPILLISASKDKTIKVWNLPNRTLINTLKGHEASVNSVAITQDRKFIVSGSSDQTLKVWDLSNGHCLHTFKGYVGNVHALNISPSGKHIICSSDKYLKVWNLYSRVELPDPIGHGSAVNTMVVTPNGRQAISASENGIIKVWDLDTRTEVFNIKGHDYRLNALAVTPNSRQLISSSSSNIRLWDLSTGALIDSFKIFEEDTVQALVVTPDGKQVVAASNSMAGASAAVWDVNSRPHSLPPTDFSLGDVCAVAVTSDMKHVILGSRSHLFKVRNLNGGEEVSAFQAEKWNLSTRDFNRGLRAMAISPDGLIVSGTSSTDGTIKVWNLTERREIHTLVGHTEAISAVAITARGKRVISVSEDGTLKVWDLTRGTVIASYDSDTSLYSCAVTPDGRIIVAGDGIGRVHFLYLESI